MKEAAGEIARGLFRFARSPFFVCAVQLSEAGLVEGV